MKIANSVIWVTGGTSGIGKGCAEYFAKKGAKVAISGRNREKGAEIAAAIGENCFYVYGDVTKSEENFATANAIIEKWGRIDILINMAGSPHVYPLFDANGELSPLDPYVADIQTNLIGTYDTTRIAAYHMKKNELNEDGERGCIINCSSLAAVATSGDFLFGYKSAKEGVRGLTRCFAPALAPYCIRVNTVLPGFIRSGITTNPVTNLGIDPDGDIAAHLFPTKIGEPWHIAKACEFIIEDPFMNRTDISVDAGALNRY